MKQDVKLSRKYSRKLGKFAEPGACFRNAQLLVLELRGENVFYVEGYASLVGGQHGWVELDGKVIDITPGWIGNGEVEYFPGPKYTCPEVLKLTEKGIVNLELWWRGGGLDARNAFTKARTDCLKYLGVGD